MCQSFHPSVVLLLLLLLLSRFSRVRLLATPWTAAFQTPPSVGFSRQQYWSGVPLPSPSVVLTRELIIFSKCFLGSVKVLFLLYDFQVSLYVLGWVFQENDIFMAVLCSRRAIVYLKLLNLISLHNLLKYSW